jgi:hypothetical protein
LIKTRTFGMSRNNQEVQGGANRTNKTHTLNRCVKNNYFSLVVGIVQA